MQGKRCVLSRKTERLVFFLFVRGGVFSVLCSVLFNIPFSTKRQQTAFVPFVFVFICPRKWSGKYMTYISSSIQRKRLLSLLKSSKATFRLITFEDVVCR